MNWIKALFLAKFTWLLVVALSLRVLLAVVESGNTELVKGQMTFPKIELIVVNCLPRPRTGVSHVPQVIDSFDNTRDLI